MCIKQCHRSKNAALLALIHIRIEKPERGERGVYFCSEHYCWHLTSKKNKWTPITLTELYLELKRNNF